jgi:hypothetical protein
MTLLLKRTELNFVPSTTDTAHPTAMIEKLPLHEPTPKSINNSPLVHVNVGLLADDVGEAAADTLD